MLTNVRILSRLAALSTLLLLFIAGFAAEGLIALGGIRESLRTVYEDRTVPLVQLAEIVDLQGEVRENLSKIPRSSAAELSGIETAINRLNKESDRLWSEYMATSLTADEKRLSKQAEEVVDEFKDAQVQILAAARKGDRELAERLESERNDEAFAALNTVFDQLKQLQADVAKSEYNMATDSYESAFALIVTLFVVALISGAGLSVAISRSVTVPLAGTISRMEGMT